MHTYRPEREQWGATACGCCLFFFLTTGELAGDHSLLARLSHIGDARGAGGRFVDSLPAAMALAADPMDHRDYCVEPAARIWGPRSSGALCAVEPRALVYLARRRHDDARSSDLCTAFRVAGDVWLPGR